METTFAIEIAKKDYFPIQDDRFNITALRDREGGIVQYSRFTPFGTETLLGDLSIVNPWRFASKRQVGDLSLFPKRFYNPQLMRWQSPDPLGFKDGLNLYTFVHNNPFRYHDPDGQFAFVLPLLVGTFGGGAIVISTPTLYMIGGALLGGVLGWSASVIIDHCNDHRLLNENTHDNGGDKDLPFPGTIAELEEDTDWEETTHPKQKERGHREFKHVITGEEIRFDKGEPGRPGHQGRDHYHRYNPQSKNNSDLYLDHYGNPVSKGVMPLIFIFETKINIKTRFIWI